MKVFGKWLYNVSSGYGQDEFQKRYKTNAFDYLIRHKITTITKVVSYSCVVVLDYNEQPLQIFFLEKNEDFNIYTKNKPTNNKSTDNKLIHTNSMSFIWFNTEDLSNHIYALEDSSYEMKIEDWDNLAQRQFIIEKIQILLNKHTIEHTLSDSNIMFIKQL